MKLNKLVTNEIQMLKESDDLSQYETVQFSDDFKKKYSNLMTFCTDGSIMLSFS